MSARDPDRPVGIPAYPLLDGHVRKKKKLISPLKAALPEMRMVSTVDTILPELIWIGGVFEVHGVSQGIEIVSDFLKCLWDSAEAPPPEFYRQSVLADRGYSDRLLGSDHFKSIEIVFATLAAYYGDDFSPKCSIVVDEKSSAVFIERLVKKYWNRYEQPFLIVAATVVYSLGVAGRLHLASGVAPNLESIANDFGSPEEKMASAFVRSSLLALFPSSEDERAAGWCRAFWESNYRGTDCQINV